MPITGRLGAVAVCNSSTAQNRVTAMETLGTVSQAPYRSAVERLREPQLGAFEVWGQLMLCENDCSEVAKARRRV